MKPRLLLFPLLLCAWASGFAQAGYTHVELQGGYELFPGMSNKSGVCLNLGGRYAFNERLFGSTTSCTHNQIGIPFFIMITYTGSINIRCMVWITNKAISIILIVTYKYIGVRSFQIPIIV